VSEAAASGVPAIVTHDGGPKYLVSPGENGQLAGGAGEFARWILQWPQAPERLAEMRLNGCHLGKRLPAL
jgi:glycosyltransferase involved in cell wall biosynthesis